MMQGISNCCRDCKDRYPACHDYCEKYQAAAKEWEKHKAHVKAERFDEFYLYKITSIKAESRRKRSKQHYDR